MKISFDRNTLMEALSGVSRAVAARSTVPAVEGILCRADDSGVSLAGYDFELAITTKIEAEVRQGGASFSTPVCCAISCARLTATSFC